MKHIHTIRRLYEQNKWNDRYISSVVMWVYINYQAKWTFPTLVHANSALFILISRSFRHPTNILNNPRQKSRYNTAGFLLPGLLCFLFHLRAVYIEFLLFPSSLWILCCKISTPAVFSVYNFFFHTFYFYFLACVSFSLEFFFFQAGGVKWEVVEYCPYCCLALHSFHTSTATWGNLWWSALVIRTLPIFFPLLPEVRHSHRLPFVLPCFIFLLLISGCPGRPANGILYYWTRVLFSSSTLRWNDSYPSIWQVEETEQSTKGPLNLACAPVHALFSSLFHTDEVVSLVVVNLMS